MEYQQFGELYVGASGYVRVVEFRRGPENFFDFDLISAMADVFDKLGEDPNCRAIVLASEGKAFCAGASYSAMQGPVNPDDLTRLYNAAGTLFRSPKPVVAAIQGAAIGGGLGMALSADFRVASPAARFSANFVKIGIHPGFGVSLTLAHVIGFQKANLMIQTGRRIRADEALEWGLVDQVVPESELREAAIALAAEIAEAAPLALQAARRTARRGLADAVAERVKLEAAEQMRLYATKDFAEGARAVQERRPGNFVGA
ncbi:MAG: enoyl-CoA hydratase/isomerase family protein [Phenylobacterium sp.]|uniref:enoyl-CoA hydratase/isomerase family protein n=1 Tax=Phenylobacterium sp. TaxID=1871053 RepID=UPI002734836A|nr:enoyl-CoA hydratase/isomerase family protein [Phenylobacterium sp.]MDP3750009.1 enoyl-CoA hydratase/isomerase family protein [Phenylobacterium sp.]